MPTPNDPDAQHVTIDALYKPAQPLDSHRTHRRNHCSEQVWLITLSDMNGELTFTIRLSATPRGARLARRLTVQQLPDWTCPFETAEQLVTELANSAITHGRVPGRDFRLTLTLTPTDTLRIEVTDARGDTTPRDPGYGLLLVEALADAWGTKLGPPPTKTVWAELAASKPS
ncbi:ATP-binding protein [Streptomyces sp. NBC_01003]|uniref:ATP-binding protein n=1 Tax=Streptomyces sp. NBC_01003 TaxID=2903714 RepID=UPI0038638932